MADISDLHVHTWRCTAEVCGASATYRDVLGQEHSLPTRAELIAQTLKQRGKRKDEIAAMRRKPRDPHEGTPR